MKKTFSKENIIAAVITGIAAIIATIIGLRAKSDPSSQQSQVVSGNGNNQVGTVMGNLTINAQDSSSSSRLVPINAANAEVQFLFGEWCSKFNSRTIFRKTAEGSIERKFFSPGDSTIGLPAADTPFAKVELHIYTSPAGEWKFVQKNSDGSQTFYVKLNDSLMTETRTDVPGNPAKMWKCE